MPIYEQRSLTDRESANDSKIEHSYGEKGNLVHLPQLEEAISTLLAV